MSTFDADLDRVPGLVVTQRKELAELIGFETRNKYDIRDQTGAPIGFAAEQQKGILGALMRQFFGHFRTFSITFFDLLRNPVLQAHHPFRWFFQCLRVTNCAGQPLGSIERRWSWVSKRFDILDPQGRVLLTVQSPIWRPWTFSFQRGVDVVATVKKRWSGAISEIFTDADNFSVEFQPGPLYPVERRLLLAASIFIDLMYFERKAD